MKTWRVRKWGKSSQKWLRKITKGHLQIPRWVVVSFKEIIHASSLVVVVEAFPPPQSFPRRASGRGQKFFQIFRERRRARYKYERTLGSFFNINTGLSFAGEEFSGLCAEISNRGLSVSYCRFALWMLTIREWGFIFQQRVKRSYLLNNGYCGKILVPDVIGINRLCGTARKLFSTCSAFVNYTCLEDRIENDEPSINNATDSQIG